MRRRNFSNLNNNSNKKNNKSFIASNGCNKININSNINNITPYNKYNNYKLKKNIYLSNRTNNNNLNRNNSNYNNGKNNSFDQIERCFKKFEGNIINKFKEENKNEKRKLNMKNNHLNLLEQRLKKKANDLYNKEGELNLKKQELEIRGLEMINQLNFKDEEISELKKFYNEEKNNYQNENEMLRKRIKELEYELNQYKKNKKNFDLIKDNFIVSKCEELQNENNKLKKITILQKNKIKELELKIKNNEKILQKEKENMYIKRINELEKLNKELNSYIKSGLNKKNHKNSFEESKLFFNNKNYYENSSEEDEVNYKVKEKKIYNIEGIGTICKKNKYNSKKRLDSLIKEKEMLINNGNYSKNDPLIIQLNKKINKLKKDNYSQNNNSDLS